MISPPNFGLLLAVAQ
uniref:Uncharacterized protein n=1 Tax=Anguilla anguilla TaxID=7936 RepID=A0A0E9UWQ2_ANGAN